MNARPTPEVVPQSVASMQDAIGNAVHTVQSASGTALLDDVDQVGSRLHVPAYGVGPPAAVGDGRLHDVRGDAAFGELEGGGHRVVL